MTWTDSSASGDHPAVSLSGQTGRQHSSTAKGKTMAIPVPASTPLDKEFNRLMNIGWSWSEEMDAEVHEMAEAAAHLATMEWLRS